MSSSSRLRTWAAPAVAGALVLSVLSPPASASATPAAAAAKPASAAAKPAAQTTSASSRPTARTAKPAAPAAPKQPRAGHRGTLAVVTWQAPADHGSAITGYVVTPYRGKKAAKPVSFDAEATTQTLRLASASGSWTFTVAARNAVGTGPASPRSAPARLLALPAAPTIIAVSATSTTALLSWTPGSDGGSPVTNWVITPYVGGVRQASQTVGPATTAEITGLISGTTYRFTVAARTAAGTGPESPLSFAVTANVSPTLAFATPPAGAVGVAYSVGLDATRGVPPFVWSIASGTLPPGITLNPNTGALSGLPTTAGVYPFVVRVVDAAAQQGSRLVTLEIRQAPRLENAAPPLAEVGAIYSDQLTVIGGTAPFSWSIAAGTLPPGLTLDPATGLLSGRPTAAGAYPFTVRVTDAFGLTDTQQFRLIVQAASVVTLTVDSALTNFGTPSSFHVRIGPGVAEGNVTAIDVLPNGTDRPLGTFPVTFNAADFQIILPAYGLNRFRVQFDASNTNAVANSNTVTVDIRAVPGQVIIGQFAQSGTAGDKDQFVGLRSNLAIDVPIAGFRIEAPGGFSLTIPASARPLPARRGYLVAGSDYSLVNILPDLVVDDLGPPGGGFRLVAPDVPGTVTDAAGSAPGFYEGTPLPGFNNPPHVAHAWGRIRENGQLVDTGNTRNDFRLVSVLLGPTEGVPSALGSPSPRNTLGVYQQNDIAQSTRLDPNVSSAAAPNRVVSGNTIILRFTVTNRSSTTPLTQARLQITALSQLNGAPKPNGPTPSPHGNLHVVNPPTTTSPVTLSNGDVVTVNNLRMDAPATDPPGGGLFTTLTVPLDLGGLGPGVSVRLALWLHIDTPGPFWVGWDVDALGPQAPALAVAMSANGKGHRLKKVKPAKLPPSYVVSGTVR
ncbi:putative Ig domain-containing protein [Micromonospora sp. R77]|uniref:putative Ig domain-containing protein n=1 Tax=Micromonospora sp. R77 TaxID=2925836 RepID=UPI001F60F2AC|nr:putative Ig domain-containing protein [Micromonospora sp. R77]MCI4064848.1 putative Ig domain-containing protein [Micromonospora sp. R77]